MNIIEQLKFWIFRKFIKNDPLYRRMILEKREEEKRERIKPLMNLACFLGANSNSITNGREPSGLCGLVVNETGYEKDTMLIAPFDTEEYDNILMRE